MSPGERLAQIVRPSIGSAEEGTHTGIQRDFIHLAKRKARVAYVRHRGVLNLACVVLVLAVGMGLAMHAFATLSLGGGTGSFHGGHLSASEVLRMVSLDGYERGMVSFSSASEVPPGVIEQCTPLSSAELRSGHVVLAGEEYGGSPLPREDEGFPYLN